jgi:hypothetical protein
MHSAVSEPEPTTWQKLRHDKRVLIVGVLLLVALLVGGAVLTTAAFTASSSNGSSVATGDVSFDLVPAGAIVDTSALRPGATKTGVVQIVNRKAAATFTLGFTGLGASTLAATLQFTVAEVSPQSRQLYSGPLSAVPSLALGRIVQGQSMQLSLTFAWAAADNSAALQGQSVPLVLQWSATT